jgi:hypothetical protein
MSIPTSYVPSCSVSIESLQKLAAQRDLPLGQEQRRDSQGQFVSHRDISETKRQA